MVEKFWSAVWKVTLFSLVCFEAEWSLYLKRSVDIFEELPFFAFRRDGGTLTLLDDLPSLLERNVDPEGGSAPFCNEDCL